MLCYLEIENAEIDRRLFFLCFHYHSVIIAALAANCMTYFMYHRIKKKSPRPRKKHNLDNSQLRSSNVQSVNVRSQPREGLLGTIGPVERQTS